MPEFCENCEHFTENGSCGVYPRCIKWRIWFHDQWKSIQENAQRMKEVEQTRR